MDVKELRIGNYVLDNGEISEVIQIESNGNVMTTCKSKFPISHIQDLEPVKLTENLLLRCGLSKVGSCFASELLGVGTLRFILNEIENRFFIEYGGKQIRVASLHELQNIYVFITKRDLKIEIPEQSLF